MQIETTLKELISNALAEIIGKEASLAINLEIPSDSKNGDYSSPFALESFKTFMAGGLLGEMNSPRMFAEALSAKLNSYQSSFIEKVEVAGPGFINFHLNKQAFSATILKKALASDFYNYNDGLKTKIIVEHTSVNPNKAMHIGHLRNAFIGDMIVNILKKFNYKVEVHNYIDDTGVQVADTTLAIMEYGDHSLEKNQSFDDYAWDIYAEINKHYKTDKTLELKRENISKELERGEGEIYDLSQSIVFKIVQKHLELLRQFKINYDLMVYESDILGSHFWDIAFDKLKGTSAFYLETEGDQKGCWVLKYKDEKLGNKIFVRSNGTVVYTAKDLAYHMWKFGILGKDFDYVIEPAVGEFVYRTVTSTSGVASDRSASFGSASKIITVIDNRQEYPQEMVKYALQSIGYEEQYKNYNHLSYGVVNLSSATAKELGLDVDSEKGSYAMSGRKGIGVKAKDILRLLEEKVKEAGTESDFSAVAVGALKHYMLKFNTSTEIIFDYTDALNLKGNTGPYLQYSFARANNILAKAGKQNYAYDEALKFEMDENTFNLIKLMGEWNGVLEKASKDLILSYIADYAFRLSSAFHKFYETNNVLKSDAALMAFRLVIVKSYINTIKDVLDVMGIESLESM